MDVAELVALGGLLHDVGKPVQRAGIYPADHSEQGATFLRNLTAKTRKPEYELLALFAEFHHRGNMRDEEIRNRIREVSPGRFGLSEEDVFRAIWLVYEADNLSSSERESSDSEFYRFRPLSSIFNRELEYPVKTVEFKGGEGLPVPGREVRPSRGAYEKVVSGLKEGLTSSEPKVDRLMPVLEKYLTFVSSVTKEGNVISLYDHMKMTSAIALAMFHAGCTAEDVKSGRCRREKRFLLIEGDFSGIQDFIYGVSDKGTLKYLRARSAYLELIGWDVVLELLSRLNLTMANVVFNAGGHFLIVAQNTPEAAKALESLRKHVAEWLYREFEDKLYLAIEWEPVSGEELGRRNNINLFDEARKRLKRRLTIKKLRRFSEVEGLFSTPSTSRLEECAVCGREAPAEELEPFKLSDDPDVKACRKCNELAELGKDLPRLRGFVLDVRGREGESMVRGPFRYVLPYRRDEQIPRGEFLLLKNSLDPLQDIPTEMVFVPYLVADHFKEGEQGGIITFKGLAENSIGAKRIGVLKGDVDDLGNFFSSMDSLSKLATASRFMDYFFKAYIDEIIRGKFGDVIGEVPSLRDWPDKPDIMVVYAGGDDFFIVGSWDQVLELTFKVREAFRAYTGGSLTLSAGLGNFSEKTPIYRMAEVVGERLETAKDERKEKDSLMVMGRSRPEDGNHPLSCRWRQYEGLWRSYAPRIYVGNGKLKRPLDSKRGLLMRLLELRELYVRNPNDVRWAYLTAYMLGRHKLSESFPELVGMDAEAATKGEPQPIYWIDVVLKVILMAVRR